MQGNNKNPFYNYEGYADPTAYHATKGIMKEEADLERKVQKLIHLIRDAAELAGFEVVGRIHLKHKKTRKEFR